MQNEEWADLEDEAIRMIRVAVPELQEENLYLCDAAKLTGNDTPSKTIYGCTSLENDLVVMPYVAWKGRGAAVTYSRSAIEADVFEERNVRLRFLSLVVHEFGHVIREGYLSMIRICRDIDESRISLCREADVFLIQREANENDGYKSVTLRHHDSSWVRTCAHLKHRIEARCGELLALSMICSRTYGPHMSLFGHALGDEPRVFADWPIEKILALPPPRLFTELFEEATRSFHEANATPKAKKGNPEMDAEMLVEVARVASNITPVIKQGDQAVEAINKIRDFFGLQKTAKAKNFSELAHQVAAGVATDSKVGARVLAEAGKDPEDLQREVVRIQARLGWGKIVGAAANVETDRAKIEGAIKAADEELRKAEQRHAETVDPLAWPQRQLLDLEHAAAAAKIELTNSADESLHVEVRRLSLLIGKCNQRRHDAGNQIGSIRTAMIESSQELPIAESSLGFARKGSGDVITAEKRVASLRATLSNGEHDMLKLQKEIENATNEEAELARQVAAVKLAMLEP
jgi:hypothetical protein